MGYKYKTKEEATEAHKRQRKEYIERMGLENYKEMVRKASLLYYRKHKQLKRQIKTTE